MNSSLSQDIADCEARLLELELKSESDDRVMLLLKEQNAQQAAQIARLQNELESRTQALSQERDEAVRKAEEVSGLIMAISRMSLEGIERMRGTRRSLGTAVANNPQDRPMTTAAEETVQKYRDHLTVEPLMDSLPLFLSDGMRMVG